jgi:Flp pilus assembly protein TadB
MPAKISRNRKGRLARVAVMMTGLLASWLGTLPFISGIWWQLAAALPGGFFLGRALNKWLAKRRNQFVLEQFKRFLEYLLSKMMAGSTLEKAFIDSASDLEPLLGKKSVLLAELRQLERQLAACQPLDRLLVKLALNIHCQEVTGFLRILPRLRQAGGHVGQFVRQHLLMLAEKISLLGEISAETTQRRTEAILLSLMPFLMTGFLLKSTTYYSYSFAENNTISVVGLALAYAMAMAAAIMTLMSLSRDQSVPGNLRLAHSARYSKFLRIPGRIMIMLYRRCLPELYGMRLLQLLGDQAEACGQSRDDGQADFFARKMLFFICGIMLGACLTLAWPGHLSVPLLLPFLLAALQDQQVFSSAKRQQMLFRLEYPMFLNLVSSLLQAGLSLHAAMTISLDSWVQVITGKGQLKYSNVHMELREMARQMQLGIPVDRILEKIAPGCPVPEIQAAFMLMIRYDRMGGQEILNLLQIQSANSWSLYRQTVRKQIELQSVALLVPMVLDLVAVILSAALPALLSFQSF